MATSNPSPVEIFDLSEQRTRTSSSRSRNRARIPKRWIISAVVFYIASVVTVGLLAGLLPRRTQYVTIVGTTVNGTLVSPTTTAITGPLSTSSSETTTIVTSLSSSTTITTKMTTTPVDPSACVDDECNPRLAADLKIATYRLVYEINDTQQSIIQGTVTINFILKQPRKQIIFHAGPTLILQEPALFEDGVNRLISTRIYSQNDYVSLTPISNDMFASNQYQLIQKFSVNLTGQNNGFYRSVFQDSDGMMKTLFATKFKPTYARRAFPCFDEPKFKATTSITIRHPDRTIAISNRPIYEENMVDGLIETRFSDTFLSSTYTLAWAILPDDYGQASVTVDQRKFIAWARSGPTSKNQTSYALNIAVRSIAFLSDYLDVDEPVPEIINLLALPDSTTSDTENWGLTILRENRLILNEEITSVRQKQYLAETIADQLSHYWFGNYVTGKWWSNLWLHEAMSRWVSYKALAENYTSSESDLRSLTNDLIPVMWDDAKPSSHPIVVHDIRTTNDINSLFDSILYLKGTSIVRMLEKMVGSDRFRSSLNDFLSIDGFDIADPVDLYRPLFDNFDGEGFVKNWLEEANYPLIKVDLTVENGNTKLSFTQSRFIISDALNISFLNSTYRWKINMTCVLGGNYPSDDVSNVPGETLMFYFDQEQDNRVLTGKSYSWIKCNQDFQALFVTQYTFPTTTWSRFASVLEAKPTFFSDEDKTNLIQDAFLLAYKGLIDYSEPLRLVRSLININIDQYVHWRTFEWHWENLARMVDYLPSTLALFQKFGVQQILSNGRTVDSIVSIGPDDNDNTKLVKTLQFTFLCRMNHTETIAKATDLFRQIPVAYFNNSDIDIPVPADFLTNLYACYLKNNDNLADWQMMYNYYLVSSSPQEQLRALMAISSINDRDRLMQLLNDGLAPVGANKIRKQDYFLMVEFMSAHPVGRDIVWEFYQNNYQRMVDIFGLDNIRFGSAIRSISHYLDQPVFLQQMKDLFDRYPDAGAGIFARQQALEQVMMNLQWIQSRETVLQNALIRFTA